MDHILQSVECSTAIDGERFEKIVRAAIDEKSVPVFKAFDKTTTSKAHQKRIDLEKKEELSFSKQQEKEKKKKNTQKQEMDDGSSLLAMIQNRSKERHAKMNSIIDSIEEKHGKKRKEPDMPSEEEFLKLQAKLFKKK
jgi:DnaJ family protein C protein 9